MSIDIQCLKCGRKLTLKEAYSHQCVGEPDYISRKKIKNFDPNISLEGKQIFWVEIDGKSIILDLENLQKYKIDELSQVIPSLLEIGANPPDQNPEETDTNPVDKTNWVRKLNEEKQNLTRQRRRAGS